MGCVGSNEKKKQKQQTSAKQQIKQNDSKSAAPEPIKLSSQEVYQKRERMREMLREGDFQPPASARTPRLNPVVNAAEPT